jgi:hypothetical protein
MPAASWRLRRIPPSRRRVGRSSSSFTLANAHGKATSTNRGRRPSNSLCSHFFPAAVSCFVFEL